jgi:NodT family efflux transporter outer membrane factor (OMF) lipoprotein
VSAWWQQLNDPVLTQLVELAQSNNPSLDLALANIERARAALSVSESSALPSFSASASWNRGRQQAGSSTTVVATQRGAGVDASWELDLFGKARWDAQASRARVDARVDDWHEARVSLAAETASVYVQYRTCGQTAALYEMELQSRTETATLTQLAAKAGLMSPSDASLARASHAATQSTLVAQTAQCASLVSSLSALTGAEVSALRALLSTGPLLLSKPAGPSVPLVPVEALRQRPDVASLERELAAAHADIGVARANLYPSISLSGSVGVSSVSGSSSLSTWSFGPSISIPLFDAGRRQAVVRDAEAGYAAALARWKQGIRTAVREVEQALIELNGSSEQGPHAELAAANYRRQVEALDAAWRAGTESLLTLEEARRTALAAEAQVLQVRQSQLLQWIALYKAIGGGWQAPAAVGTNSNNMESVQGGTS